MVHISEHFTYKKIFKIVIVPILMMLFISVYGVVDGVFLSTCAGENAYEGVNLIMPIIMIVGGIGFMFGTGGQALSGKFLGEGKKEEACKVFSMLLFILIIVGIIISVGGFFLIEPIAKGLGKISVDKSDEMVNEAITYGRILILGQVGFMVQNYFQSYFLLDEKPKLGFLCTALAGVTNMIFDFVFIYLCDLGVVGAAIATMMGYVAGSIVPIIYFIKSKNDNIHLVKTNINAKYILQSCFNGSSEFVNNISTSIVSIVYSIELLELYGKIGVGAYGTIMYISFIFISVFIGYSIGVAPVISYNYGANNRKELHNILKKSAIIVFSISIIMVLTCFISSSALGKVFSSGNEDLANLASLALKIFSFTFLFSGLGIFISSFFTALNNGFISALNSFLRTIVFEIGFALLLPLIFEKDSIWWAIVAAEVCSFIISITCLKLKQHKYGY